MIRLSLRGRVTLASVAVLAAGLLTIGVAVNFLLHRALYDDAESVLRERAAAQLAALTINHGTVRQNERVDDAVLDELSWVFADGKELEHPRVSPAMEASAQRLSRAKRARFGNSHADARLLAEPLVHGGRRLGTIVVGVSLEPYRHTERLALGATGVLAVFVLVAGALVARRAVGAALRPVAEMSERAADWSAHDLHRRFDLGPPRDEMTGLAATLDGLLARIDAVLGHEQRFSAEMAHELRTPLSGVRAEAELALRGTSEEPAMRAALERIVAATDRMAAVIQTLLATARGQNAGPTFICEPAQPVAEVIEAMRPAADAHGVRIAVNAQDAAAVAADSGMVAQAFQPLLDNAISHAASAVDVALEPTPHAVVVAIEDDGRGFGAGDPEGLFAPGRSSTGGAGLGLPLARRLARSMGGDVVAVVRPAGGARFELRLPRG